MPVCSKDKKGNLHLRSDRLICALMVILKPMEKNQVWFTMGPKTESRAAVEEAIKAGATGVRLTFSFATPEYQHDRAKMVREVAARLQKPIFIVADLQGGKYRIASSLEETEIVLQKGQQVEFCADGAKEKVLVQIPLQNIQLLDQIDVGDIIVEGDGGVLVRVLEKMLASAVCEVQNDGVVHRGRGLTAQSARFKPDAITQKDISDLEEVALKKKLYDAVAVSFVSSALDLALVRELLLAKESSAQVIAKIETSLGLQNIDEIAACADILMVARGDLALAIQWSDLYDATLSIADASKKFGKPWILATQLMEGLEKFVLPTRAEMSDLAHWMRKGAGGAMLSFETAFGARPFEAIKAVRMLVEKYGDSVKRPQADPTILGHQGYGLVQLYHGHGKGKTTAALGLAMRAAGAGKKVAIVYFDKGGSTHYSERALLDKIDNIDYFVSGRDRIDKKGRFDFSITEVDKLEARRGLEFARAALAGKYDLVVLDEINSTIALDMLNVIEVIKVIEEKKSNIELVLTGRNPHPELIKHAHLVTEMKPEKHYFYSGVKAREGLDF